MKLFKSTTGIETGKKKISFATAALFALGCGTMTQEKSCQDQLWEPYISALPPTTSQNSPDPRTDMSGGSDLGIDMSPSDMSTKMCVQYPKGITNYSTQKLLYSAAKTNCSGSTFGDCGLNTFAYFGTPSAGDFKLTLISPNFVATSDDQFTLSVCGIGDMNVSDSAQFTISRSGTLTTPPNYNGCTFTFTMNSRTATVVSVTMASNCP